MKLKVNSTLDEWFCLSSCMRLVPNEPLLVIDAVPAEWQVLRQNLRIFRTKDCQSPHGALFLGHEAELRSSFVSSSMFFGCLLVSRECSFILSATDLEFSAIYTVEQSWPKSL